MLAVSDDPRARFDGGYWHNLERQEPVSEVTDVDFQNRLLSSLRELTGVELPS